MKSAEKDDSVQSLIKFMDRSILPYLESKKGKGQMLGDQAVSDDLFRVMKVGVAPAYHGQLQLMQNWCDERRQLDLQVRLHHWLHGWLLVHVPLSLFLLLLTAWHALVALTRY